MLLSSGYFRPSDMYESDRDATSSLTRRIPAFFPLVFRFSRLTETDPTTWIGLFEHIWYH